MGCLFSREQRQETQTNATEEEPKKYSWDKREKLDPKDYTIEKLSGETVGRIPGTVKGQQFIIRDNENCNIYIFDHSATIQVDDCKNCKIFMGPVKTSVFVRDCENCQIAVSCQQFRTRDCRKLDVFLHCITQPIIEASTGVKMACFQYSYPELEEQLKSAGLSIYNNSWSTVHDFTPVPGENNFSLLPEDVKIEEFLPIPTTEQFSCMKIDTNPGNSVVPVTHGSRRKPATESCLAVFFNDGNSVNRVKQFISEMRTKQPGCVLIQTKEVNMQAAEAVRVFGSEAYNTVVQQGPVIGLEYNGEDCVKHCKEIVASISQGSSEMVFVTQSPELAAEQVENFYNYADMQMAV
ncbi:protein XRP2 [Lingula anatina]|uniref:Protein XRP2 n=1 Tax=Lingula anatina TaxID=7574 RepID=A0A1S3HVH2_LINAN|nr:protein XRP2 [Lingula anatina]|eukprot:XP_013390023.1 protein XRP2 [Lingula anatina]